MEVLVATSFGGGRDCDRVESSSAAMKKKTTAATASSSCLFIKEDDEEDTNEMTTRKSIFGSGLSSSPSSSSSSSSIGVPDDSDDEEEEEDDASSTVRKSSSFGYLTSLEDSLPTKRGLSNHYTGKSKSFSNLLDMATTCTPAKDIVKPDNPFNKRRRLVMANKWHRKFSFYSSKNNQSMPILASLVEEEEEENDNDQIQNRIEEEDDEDEDEIVMRRMPSFKANKLKASGFKTCFSLADLREHDDDIDDDIDEC